MWKFFSGNDEETDNRLQELCFLLKTNVFKFYVLLTRPRIYKVVMGSCRLLITQKPLRRKMINNFRIVVAATMLFGSLTPEHGLRQVSDTNPPPHDCVQMKFRMSWSHPFQATVEVYERDIFSADDFKGRLNLSSESGLATNACDSTDEMLSPGFQYYFIVMEQNCVEPPSKFAAEYQYYPVVDVDHFYNFSVYWQLNAIGKPTFAEMAGNKMQFEKDEMSNSLFQFGFL